MADLAQDRENPGVQRRQVIEIVAIDVLDPGPVVLRRSGVAHTDGHA